MAISQRTLERSMQIRAPRSAVWDALTIPEQLGRWLLPASLGATMKREGETLSVVIGGFMTADVAAIESEEPPRSMTLRGLPDRLLSISWSLDEEPDGTRMTVAVSGFDALTSDAVDERLAISGPAWEEAIENLRSVVEGSERAHPETPVAALFGYRRQGPEVLSVERSVWIDAPRDVVWAAVTEVDKIQAWFSPGTEWRRSGDGVGARLVVVDPATGEESHVEVIDALEPPHRCVTHSEPRPGVTSHVTEWTLTQEGDGTRVTVRVSGYESQAPDGRDSEMEQNAFGFGMMLQNLRAFVDGQELPFPGGF